MAKKEKKRSQGIFETVKQVNEQEKRREEERQERFEKKHEKEREDYSKRIAEEKIELLKLKQGVSDISENVYALNEEQKKYSIGQRISNFIYHNKWWLGIAAFMALIAGFLVYDKLTTTKPDAIVLLLCDDGELYSCYDRIGEYFDSISADYNEDDENYVDILYIPITGDGDDASGLYESNLARLSTEFQMGESMIVIADSKADELIEPEESLTDIERLYPETEGMDRQKFYLKNTDFAERIGFEGTLPDDLYIAVRKVRSNLITAEKSMQKNHENAMDILERFIDDMGD